jgi:hypothetical protein
VICTHAWGLQVCGRRSAVTMPLLHLQQCSAVQAPLNLISWPYTIRSAPDIFGTLMPKSPSSENSVLRASELQKASATLDCKTAYACQQVACVHNCEKQTCVVELTRWYYWFIETWAGRLHHTPACVWLSGRHLENCCEHQTANTVWQPI